MDLIWAKREGKYFCSNDWTGSISLIGFEKLAVGCKGSTWISLAIFSPPSFRGDAKHQTRNLEIPDRQSRIPARARRTRPSPSGWRADGLSAFRTESSSDFLCAPRGEYDTAILAIASSGAPWFENHLVTILLRFEIPLPACPVRLLTMRLYSSAIGFFLAFNSIAAVAFRIASVC